MLLGKEEESEGVDSTSYEGISMEKDTWICVESEMCAVVF